MQNKCPGQSLQRNLDSVMVICPACGRKVEIFTDEPKRRCRCGETVRREQAPSCAQWCQAASLCLGEVMDREQWKKQIEMMKDNVKAKEYVKRIQEQHRKKKQGR